MKISWGENNPVYITLYVLLLRKYTNHVTTCNKTFLIVIINNYGFIKCYISVIYNYYIQALLGTYHCTEVPGEFVWRPGILTRAVTEGCWALLEDIDYAPMDVVSILLPLLERGVLSIPGHGENVTAHPNFRLFATQR